VRNNIGSFGLETAEIAPLTAGLNLPASETTEGPWFGSGFRAWSVFKISGQELLDVS